jgi:hypothetical protein
MGLCKSHTSPSTVIESTSFASLGLMERAMSIPVTPSSNSCTELSGNVILIMEQCLF